MSQQLQRIGLIAGLAALAVLASSCSATVEGILSMKGPEPRTVLCVTLDDGRMLAIAGPLLEELTRMQGSRVQLSGEFSKDAPLPLLAGTLTVTHIVKKKD